MKTLHLPILILLIALPATVVFGQKDTNEPDDGPVGIFQSRSEYYEFMGSAKRAAYGEGGTPELRAMIPMLNDIALNKQIGWTANEYGDERSTIGLLSDSKIRADLEMVDDQYEELQRMNEEVQKRAGEQLRALDFGDRENLVSQIRNIREQAENDLNSVLLPHQMQRLRQIRSQSQLRRRSLVEVITSEPFKTELEISDEQSEQLRDAERDIEKDLEKEIAELREKARKKLLSKLKRSQKQRVEEIFGETFEFSEPAKEKSPRKKRK